MAKNCKRGCFQIGGETEQTLTEQQIQTKINEHMVKRWQWSSFTPEPQGFQHTRPPKEDDVPLVSVCVEGGPGTISTVYEAVKNGVSNVMFGAWGGCQSVRVVHSFFTDPPQSAEGRKGQSAFGSARAYITTSTRSMNVHLAKRSMNVHLANGVRASDV